MIGQHQPADSMVRRGIGGFLGERNLDGSCSPRDEPRELTFSYPQQGFMYLVKGFMYQHYLQRAIPHTSHTHIGRVYVSLDNV
jgi:hypothetical protein